MVLTTGRAMVVGRVARGGRGGLSQRIKGVSFVEGKSLDIDININIIP